MIIIQIKKIVNSFGFGSIVQFFKAKSAIIFYLFLILYNYIIRMDVYTDYYN